MMVEDIYCIRSDYISQVTNQTVAPESAYWTPAMIRKAAYYQHDVYWRGRELIVKHGLGSVLDIGCGPALKLQSLIAPLCNDIVGLDDQRIVEYCRQHFDFGQFIACDIEHDPFPVQRTFDLIICADVIEHLVDPDKLLDAIRAAATPDSWIVLSTPDRDILRGKGCLRSPKRMHVREWTSAEFAIYLTSRSFVIHEHTLLPPIKFYWSTEYFQQRFLQLRAGRSFASCQMVVCKKRP